MAAGGGEPAGLASANERAEPQGGCGAAGPRMALRGQAPPPPRASAGIRSPRGTSPPPSGLRGSPITLRPCQGLRLPSGPPCCLRRSAKDATLGGEGRGGKRLSLGISLSCLGSQVARSSSSTLRARSLVRRACDRVGGEKSLPEKPGGGGEPCSASTLMKPTPLSTLMTLDQNSPNGPGRPQAFCWDGVGGGVRGVDPPPQAWKV